MYFIVFGLLRGELRKTWYHDINCTFVFCSVQGKT